jgi:hypothetical protein
MTKRYSNQRREEVRKKEARKKILEKPKIVITDEIICASCSKFSGWTNDDLRFVSGEKEIKCTNCGKPCIQTLCKKRNISNNE